MSSFLKVIYMRNKLDTINTNLNKHHLISGGKRKIKNSNTTFTNGLDFPTVCTLQVLETPKGYANLR